jgi:hypothetical protein
MTEIRMSKVIATSLFQTASYPSMLRMIRMLLEQDFMWGIEVEGRKRFFFVLPYCWRLARAVHQTAVQSIASQTQHHRSLTLSAKLIQPGDKVGTSILHYIEVECTGKTVHLFVRSVLSDAKEGA